MRERRENVYGPHRYRGGWKVIHERADGTRTTRTLSSEAEADALAKSLRATIEARTVASAVDAFIAYETQRGLRDTTTVRQRFHLTRLLQLGIHGHRDLRWLTPAVAARLYLESQRGAVDTHRNGLSVAKQWATWCVMQGWLKASPFQQVKGKGKRRHGKPQLRIDEGRRFLATTLDAADRGDQGAIFALGCMFLGCRSTELLARIVRDLDDDCRVLWIDKAKCERSEGARLIPEWLRPYFRYLAKDKLPGAPLFSAADGRARKRDWATDQVPRLCRLAGVSRVTPHGLRGMAATLAKIGGAQDQAIAAALGHDVTMTRTHYFDRQQIEAEQRGNMLQLLQGGKK